MARASSLLLLVIYHLSLLSLAEEVTGFNPSCPPLPCGNLGFLSFPFSSGTNPECGLLKVENCSEPFRQKIELGMGGPWFYIREINQDNSLILRDQVYPDRFKNHICRLFQNFTLSSSFEFPIQPAMFNCSNYSITTGFELLCHESNHSIILYNHTTHPSPPAGCSVIQSQLTKTQKSVFLHNIYNGGFFLQVNVTKECLDCYSKRGQFLSDSNGKFQCSGSKTGNRHKTILKLTLGFGIGGSVLLIVALSIYIMRHHRKGIYASPNSRYTSSDPSSKSDLEAASAYFGVPIFSYSELAEATNNFNHEKELGDGGFGTVYYGKLRDGREVAVKRLYEHNYRRVEQFMNEIEILTRLRHKNLVSLYGCTSRHSQGLLLVYEFIPNGTIADHLHGDRANPCLLTWPIRMNIAIETASSLAYLHASDIIHRDVKTNNILLDNNFCVKVADFGLSRLFPTDVTHVSTAPQGTPGYVDPEYHQCYQLTDKSDVYSFGVVLIELISSMPAVDISRHRHEINLANLAINRIQKQAVDELLDPCLGFHSDEEVKRTATSVAELAFLCLQQNKEMRPSMDVVLEELQRIKSGECKPENLTREDDDNKTELKSMQHPPPSPPYCEESALLKNTKLPPSPISVTEIWDSINTTPNVSN
ncbi:hypothetical protein Dsin_028876 [Dipteronia sinensis]|uniref:non-specific serine/threonine protein kinase n=1 Tax=Dipteronia sinensis TaxID=43782 RepID=A0AAD9ZRE3_9ROSI|nr:hypothetical protein Dsin_028876 [Dipteronia sinensis]